MESSELAAAPVVASRRVSLPFGGDDYACRAPLRWSSPQESFFRLCSFLSIGWSRFCSRISSPSGAAISAACFFTRSSHDGLVYRPFFY